jgi:hypothetical protein
MTTSAIPRACLGVLLAGVLAVSACSDGAGSGAASSTAGASTSASASSGESTPEEGSPTDGTPAPYLPVPDGIVLTDQGSELGLGEPAVVAWRPRQGEVGVLKLTVRSLEHADIKALKDWQLDAAGRASSLYYVTVSVKNLGDGDLGGRRIPLYLLAGLNTLVESNAFRSHFEPCPSPALPKSFGPGDQTKACLVYLVPRHGQLHAASFRPTEDFNPITWVGKVTEWKPPKPRKKTASGG